MKISLNWLKRYIDFDFTPEELAHELTMAGLEVEDIKMPQKSSFTGVVIADILSVEKHPDADKLSVCQIDVGSETIQVVCGAPNVAAGQKVPLALVGAELGEFKIKPVKLRGIKSHGMICSERELGISDSHDGIMVFDQDAGTPGTKFTSKSNVADVMLEIDLTPNRPDCLSHIGVAREIGAIINKKITKPPISMIESDRNTSDFIEIIIEDSEACPRYCARYLTGVTIKESPDWLKDHLSAVGIRPVNNVVDVTNFVLMETGQPLHAFDYTDITDGVIKVRKANSGEKFKTLDGVERLLEPNDLLICDGKRAIALAGVMGGENSEVKDNTVDILLESAFFDPMTIRKTAKRLGLSTEASQRFERGIDPNNAVWAIDRAAQLISELGEGEIASNVVDIYPKPVKSKILDLSPKRLSEIIGVEIPEEQIISILDSLDFKVTKKENLEVTVPTFRPDVNREIDLIEEVLRRYGYNNVPSATELTIPLRDNRNRLQEFIEVLKDTVAGMGFYEALNSSLVPEKYVKLYTGKGESIRVINPLNPETSFLRTSLLPGLLTSVQWNLNRSTSDCKLFEIGKTFISHSKETLPDERTTLSGLLSGNLKTETFWTQEDDNISFYNLKGFIEEFLKRSYIRNFEFKRQNHPLFSDAFTIQSADVVIGFWGQINSSVQKSWSIDNPIFGFEMYIEELLSCSAGIAYQPVSKYPPVKRDIAFLVDNSITAEAIRSCIFTSGGPFLSKVALFDSYKGDQIPSTMKSLAFSLVFVSNDRTLNDKDIDLPVKGVIDNVCRKLKAKLRS